MINRRRFMQAGAATTAALAFPFRAFPFSQSATPIHKFKVSLPLLIADTDKSMRGIPVLTADTMSLPGTDVYEINAVPFTQNLLGAASTLGHKTKLWGYASVANNNRQYLGGVIVAIGGKHPVPVQLKVTNKLPVNHILPNDVTLLDPASGETDFGPRQDRIAVHLHGSLVFWAYDGGPFLWFSNAAKANGGFVKGSSCINASAGTGTYNYPNQQSARMLWYHDHAYGLTRTNVFAGLASAYLITDSVGDGGEMDLINDTRDIIPGKGLDAETGLLGFPLILQDKTFWEADKGDMNYPSAVPGVPIVAGDLWYPHVYEGAPLADLPTMGLPASAFGALAPAPTARWELGTGTPPTISSVAEYFSDTILVNGAPYPTLDVKPQRYRFRILNASQGRFYNLQTYVADPSSDDGITLKPLAVDPLNPTPDEVDNNGNLLLIPDPSVNTPGPAFIQIANECGFLPKPALFSTSPTTNLNSNLIIKYKNVSTVIANRRRTDAPQNTALPGDPTLGNVNQHNLLLAAAERADVIIDFRGFKGKEIILYSDAPAPFPGGDTRNDYYVFDPVPFGLAADYTDQTLIGGAPSTLTGEGPDTRVLMKFVVSNTANSMEPNFAKTVGLLETELPLIFARTQPPQPLSGGKTFVKTLNEDKDEHGRLRQLLGVVPLPAVQTFLDVPTEVAIKGEVQTWDIYNTTADTHPMHFHLVNVEVLKRRQWAFNPDGTPKFPLTPIGPDLPIDDNERGWRETVRMNPGEVTTVAMKFDLPTGTAPKNSPRLLASYGIKGAEYVWHCHILEHEEHDMMHALVVV